MPALICSETSWTSKSGYDMLKDECGGYMCATVSGRCHLCPTSEIISCGYNVGAKHKFPKYTSRKIRN